jgi:chromosome segregation ATPase
MIKTDDVIIKTLRRIENDLASKDRDMAKDRQDIQDLNIKLQSMGAELSELRKAINLNAERTKDKVAEAVEPISQATQNLASKIEKSKTVVFGIDNRPWWKRLIGEFRKEVAN